MTLVPSTQPCPIARELTGRTWLAREAPDLPLAGCTRSHACRCRFRKHDDRRSGEDRRPLGTSETGRWYAGSERRSAPRRKRNT